MSANWTEKRRFPRISIKLPLRYQIRGTPEFNRASSADLSIGGLGFITAGFIAPNSYLNIEINLSPRIINATARVVRADSLRRSDSYQLGVEFCKLGYQEKQLLSDYINQQRLIS